MKTNNLQYKIALSLGVFLLIISWLVPDHYRPWLSSTHEFISFSAAIILFIAALIQLNTSHYPDIPKIFILFVLIAFIPLAQYFYGLIFLFGDALISSLYLLAFSAMLFAGYTLRKNDKQQPSFICLLAGAIVTAAIISALIALAQWLVQPTSIWIEALHNSYRPFANLGQPNHLATLLSMGLAGVLFFYEKHFLNRISSSLLALVLLFTVALTQSRTPWLMAIFFIFFGIWKLNNTDRRLQRTTALAWIALFVSFIFILPHLAQRLQLSSLTSVAERAQATERWDLYVQFCHAIVQGPLWGYGWQQVSTAQAAITPLFPVALYSEYTHNILLDLLIWNGPILGSLIIFAVTTWLFRLAFLARTTESLFVLLAVGFFLVHCMLEYPHAYAYFLLPVGLLLGILQAEFSCKTWQIRGWLLWIIAASSVVLYTLIWQEYRILEADHRLMRFEQRRIGTLKAEQPAPNVVFLTQLQALIKHTRTPATSNMSEEELHEFSRLAQRFTHPASIFKHAKALALNNQLEQAYQQLLLIQGLHGDKLLLQAIYELNILAKKHSKIAPLLQRLHAIPLDHVKQFTENTDDSAP